MTDTPYTLRDGVYRSTYEGRAWLAASPPGGAAFGCDRTPCLVVTGDLAAARARLAPPVVSGDARARVSGTCPSCRRERYSWAPGGT